MEWTDKELDALRKGTPRSQSNPDVLVYTTPTCPYCSRAKSYLKEKGVKYTEIDVEKNRDKAIEMVKVSGQNGIPVLVINGRVVVGFNPPLIDDALSRPPLAKRENGIQNLVFDPFDQ